MSIKKCKTDSQAKKLIKIIYNRRSLLCTASTVLVCLLILVYYSHLRFGNIVHLRFRNIVYFKKEFVVREYAGDDAINGISLDHCKIPLVQLSNMAYLRAYENVTTLMDEMRDVCAKTPDFSKLENNRLYLTNMTLNNCCVFEVTRKWRDPRDNYTLPTSCVKIENSMNVKTMEFMGVRCDDPKSSNNFLLNQIRSFLYKSRPVVYNFHANVPMNGRLKSRVDFWKNRRTDNERPYSIFTLVIDSTSRAEFFRSLTSTMNQLRKHMNFVELRGHHPLGEPTQPNAVPMLMGISRSTFQSNYFKFEEQVFWDNSPFIWHAFNELNYITGYFEDDPAIGTFNYDGQLGFEEQPTTLYTRPLMAAYGYATSYIDPNLYEHYCFGHRNVIEFMLDYHFETLTRLSEVPTFQVTWPCWIQHDYGGSLSFLDQTYKNFFKKIAKNKQILENTIFVITSDHGYARTTHNSYADSHQGFLERLNVPLFIRLPDRMRRERPEMMENLKWNSHLVTSHYDIYQTFVHIAKMVGDTAPLSNLTTYGNSLLEKIPINRTCDEAQIPRNRCGCNRPSKSTN